MKKIKKTGTQDADVSQALSLIIIVVVCYCDHYEVVAIHAYYCF